MSKAPPKSIVRRSVPRQKENSRRSFHGSRACRRSNCQVIWHHNLSLRLKLLGTIIPPSIPAIRITRARPEQVKDPFIQTHCRPNLRPNPVNLCLRAEIVVFIHVRDIHRRIPYPIIAGSLPRCPNQVLIIDNTDSPVSANIINSLLSSHNRGCQWPRIPLYDLG